VNDSNENGKGEVAEAAGDRLTAAQLHEILRLRVNVFVVEQECAYPEIDGRDLSPGTRHFWISGEHGVDAYLRVLTEAGGVRRVGRVCTSGPARGTGLGERMMAAAMDHVGASESVLSAQTYAVGFYGRFGYQPEGAEYLDDGIPHITMRRPAGERLSGRKRATSR